MFIQPLFFKVMQYGYETFQNVAPILHTVICFEMNTASIQTKDCCKSKGIVISSFFLWKLFPFIVKRFYNLLYNPICGILCLLS